ncbi:hypothetical protein M8Z33_03060 [Streptomyces sp. ZAF1911]|uniref:hypothetical protein n=1 Tax=Streptomyces sp. ZAF1911 TaxID=2944129 RepID=UPI00237BA022|nr:hypothetical protein [Streptomyces sp. ZAF1911]MDD9375670.1 hypothetical protein [Streptomyces sp. ZAF1911]
MSVSRPMVEPSAGPMKMAMEAVVAGRPAASSSAATPDRDPRCPSAAEHCASQKVVLAQDVSAGRTDALSRPMAGSQSPLVAQPNAPPPAEAPPDLHRLCVSRT